MRSRARGFNGCRDFANKLLVLIDGRSVYTPLFSGVFWDAQDVLLEDIDRIEVISGPGGDAVGRQRRQRRDQHHHPHGARTPQGGLVAAGGGNRGAACGPALRRDARATPGPTALYAHGVRRATTALRRPARARPTPATGRRAASALDWTAGATTG